MTDDLIARLKDAAGYYWQLRELFLEAAAALAGEQQANEQLRDANGELRDLLVTERAAALEATASRPPQEEQIDTLSEMLENSYQARRELQAQINELEARVDAASLREPPQARWQPIETAPKDGREVLLLLDSSIEIGWWRNVPQPKGTLGETWRDRSLKPVWPKPTGWLPMPLPWTDDLHLGDVIDKHLQRHLEVATPERKDDDDGNYGHDDDGAEVDAP